MLRWQVALVCLSTAMTLLEGSCACKASGSKDAGQCERGHEYRICGAPYAGVQYAAQWWFEHIGAITSYPQLVADRRHSEGCRYVLEINAENERMAGARCSYARLAADPRHIAGRDLVLRLNSEQDGTGTRPAVERQVDVGGEQAAHSLAHLSGQGPWQPSAGVPSWCGCDVAWFDTQEAGPFAAHATRRSVAASLAVGQGSDRAALPGDVSGNGILEWGGNDFPGLLGRRVADLWNSAVKVAREHFASLIAAWEWLRTQPSFVRMLPLGESAAGPRQQVTPSQQWASPSAYLGL